MNLIKPKIKLHFHASGKTNGLLGQLDTCYAPFGMPSNGSSNAFLITLNRSHITSYQSCLVNISCVYVGIAAVRD